MTNERAVEILNLDLDILGQYGGESAEAYKMAIKALEQLQEKPEYIDIWNVGAILRNVPEQPDICKIYGGVCGYPIEACSECPKHEGWRPSKEQTTRWIPVSERLPEEDGFYLATCDGEICGEDEPFSGLAEFENGKWTDDEEGYQCVLAWQPLPEPYKAESEDVE